MSKERKQSTIIKPSIDYATVLQFATAGDCAQVNPGGDNLHPNSSGIDGTIPKGQIPLTVLLKEELHTSLQREAARKGRTVEEHVRKLLTKHCKAD